MLKIANLFLTRRCNLTCPYCKLAGGNFALYRYPVDEYKHKSYYLENEITAADWIRYIDLLYKHNPDIFFILYGGEPFMYKGVELILLHLNSKKMNYTIISNSTMSKTIMKIANKINGFSGFTISFDPRSMHSMNTTDDKNRYYKGLVGLKLLEELMSDNLVKDPAAELTIDSENIRFLYDSVKYLSDRNITSVLSPIDFANNRYYDFSNIEPTRLNTFLIPERKIFELEKKKLIADDSLKIHMKDKILDVIEESLDKNYQCRIHKDPNNITIESDGYLRLCARIKGDLVTKLNLDHLTDHNGNINLNSAIYRLAMTKDKAEMCEGCKWTCVMMSENGSSRDIIDH